MNRYQQHCLLIEKALTKLNELPRFPTDEEFMIAAHTYGVRPFTLRRIFYGNLDGVRRVAFDRKNSRTFKNG